MSLENLIFNLIGSGILNVLLIFRVIHGNIWQ